MRNISSLPHKLPQPLNHLLFCLQNVRHVGFYGDGYVMFDGVSLGKQEADISLSFFTKQPSALLLLGRDVNSDVSQYFRYFFCV